MSVHAETVTSDGDRFRTSYLVGDCDNVGSIFNANHDAFNVAVEV